MKTFAEAEQVLATALPGYEQRTQQQALAQRVEAVFANEENFTLFRPGQTNRRHLFGQAGCGSGKSLAYLIPAILSGRRTIVSVTTKALQDQLANKDLPFLAEHLGVTFSWCVLKGRANYFCTAAAVDADESEVVGLPEILRQSAEQGFSGLREDFNREFTPKEWALLSAEAENCRSYDCKDRGDCFAEIARERAKVCRIVVVNHALFFTDLLVKTLFDGSTGMLDEYDLVVLDEAHECFPAGTLIDGKPIEQVKVGDLVQSFDPKSGAVGMKRVSSVMSNPVGETLVRVTAGATKFVSTTNHPVWTGRGWVPAGLLVTGDTLLSHGTEATGHRNDLCGVSGSSDTLHQGQKGALPEDWPGVLRDEVCRGYEASPYAKYEGDSRRDFASDDVKQPHVTLWSSGEDDLFASQDWPQTIGARWQRGGDDRTRVDALVGAGGFLDSSVRGAGRKQTQSGGTAQPLQDRPRSTGAENCSRGGRGVASSNSTQTSRSTQGRLAHLSRVDRVEILESGRDGSFGGVCPDGLVYNFEVEDWHTYFANGVAVHNCAAVAGDCIGGQFSEGSIRSLTGNVRSWAAKFATDGEEPFSADIATLLAVSADLFAALPGTEAQSKRLGPEDLDKLADHLGNVHDAIRSLAAVLSAAKISPDVDYAKAKSRKDRVRRQGNSTYSRLIEIITADFAQIVRWVEVERKQARGRWEVRKVIKVAPVDVGPFLRENLFSQVPAIMVSATLAVKSQFIFAASALGVDNYDGIDVGSPFDFGSQARLYVPTHLPEPKGAGLAEWETQVNEEIVDLVKASHGRALVLFTSVKQMRSAYASVARRLPYEVKMQHQESVGDLSRWFAANTSGVLFGTKSFFTGFDIVGESLVNVIVAKMPFPVPTEPLTEARCEAIEARGGNAFSEYSIPVMSLVLQQAVGRLIRHTTDRGVVSILDPRMMKKSYGKAILRDLPPMPVITKIEDVQEFFVQVNSHFGTEQAALAPVALAL